MEVTDHVGNLHGRIGGLIYYTRNGRTFARRAAVPGRKPKPRTERQRATSRRFTMVQAVYHFYKENVSAEIWRAAGKRRGMTAPNLFHAMNYGCFDGKGVLVTPELFHFAEGELLAPGGLTVEAVAGSTGTRGNGTGAVGSGSTGIREDVMEGGMAGTRGDENGMGGMVGTESGMEGSGNGTEGRMVQEGETGEMEGEGWFRVRWEAGEAWATAGASDLLRVGVIYEDDERTTTRWAEEVTGRRGDGEGWFRLRTDAGNRAHVYVFFEREDGHAWSPSVYREVRFPG